MAEFKKLVKQRTGKAFPNDPWEHLDGSIGAVFNSWMNDRAIVYRRKYEIPAEWGTAVNVQTMVFGNIGSNSCSGVAFTRDPATGDILHIHRRGMSGKAVALRTLSETPNFELIDVIEADADWAEAVPYDTVEAVVADNEDEEVVQDGLTE